METIIKQTIKMGNSSAVLLPKRWERKKVKVELIEDSIERDVFDIIRKKGLLEDVMGIYLVGSYARGEERVDSDIDVLVITGSTDKFLKEGNYEILFISKEKADKNLEKSLYLYSMMVEAKTIFNKELIKTYKEQRKLHLQKFIDEIKPIVKINDENVETSEQHGLKIRDGIAYSLILRLRELYLILAASGNEKYSNKNFLGRLEKEGFGELYKAYLRIKNDKKPLDNLSVESTKKLILHVKKMIEKIENGKKRKEA